MSNHSPTPDIPEAARYEAERVRILTDGRPLLTELEKNPEVEMSRNDLEDLWLKFSDTERGEVLAMYRDLEKHRPNAQSALERGALQQEMPRGEGGGLESARELFDALRRRFAELRLRLSRAQSQRANVVAFPSAFGEAQERQERDQEKLEDIQDKAEEDLHDGKNLGLTQKRIQVADTVINHAQAIQNIQLDPRASAAERQALAEAKKGAQRLLQSAQLFKSMDPALTKKLALIEAYKPASYLGKPLRLIAGLIAGVLAVMSLIPTLKKMHKGEATATDIGLTLAYGGTAALVLGLIPRGKLDQALRTNEMKNYVQRAETLQQAVRKAGIDNTIAAIHSMQMYLEEPKNRKELNSYLGSMKISNTALRTIGEKLPENERTKLQNALGHLTPEERHSIIGFLRDEKIWKSDERVAEVTSAIIAGLQSPPTSSP